MQCPSMRTPAVFLLYWYSTEPMTGAQAALLRYTLPAMACAPPLLVSLTSQSSAKGVLLTCHILVSPSMPGSLEDVSIDLHIPSAPQAPLKVRGPSGESSLEFP